MNAVLLVAAIAFMSMQTLCLKLTGTKTLRENLLVNGVFTALIALGFGVWAMVKQLPVQLPTVLYGMLFGVMFVFTILFYYLAMQSGPLSYTSFYFSASMLVPTAAGILFWKEQLTLAVAGGTLLFLLAFFLINAFGEPDGKKAKPRWFLYCMVTFFFNGGLSVVIRMQQDATGAKEQGSMMLCGFLSACVFAFLMYVLFLLWGKGDSVPARAKADGALLKGIPLPIVGVALGTAFANLLLTVLMNRVPSSYLFPIANGGNMLVITLCSVFFFHEKLSRVGKIGIVVGLLAIVAINL